jgi:hypothetical protein
MALVAAATTSAKWLHDIGENSRVAYNSHGENTSLFVRLYEGLSEYAEERRNGSGRSYFNRAWNAAPSFPRNPGTSSPHFDHNVGARTSSLEVNEVFWH